MSIFMVLTVTGNDGKNTCQIVITLNYVYILN